MRRCAFPLRKVRPMDRKTASLTQSAARDVGTRYPPIEDYAVIGDCRTAALISSDGSIDWLCLPHFSAPSVFAALLDRDRGGYFSIRPVGDYAVTRRYVGSSAVLETQFLCATGTLTLTDL